jgi:thiol-disulfide isomerase/thioredoxin
MKKVIYILCLSIFATNAFSQNQVTISGHGDNLKENDTVEVYMYRLNFFDSDLGLKEIKKAVIKNHAFTIKFLDVRDIATMTTKIPGKYDLDEFFVSPGDDIDLQNGIDSFNITGSKSNFFCLQYAIRKIWNQGPIPRFTQLPLNVYFAKLDSIKNVQLAYLKKFERGVSQKELEIIRREVAESPRYSLIYATSYLINNRRNVKATERNYREITQILPKYDYNKFVSGAGIEYIRNRYLIDSCLLKSKRFDIKGYLQFVDQNLTGELRDRAAAFGLLTSDEKVGEVKEILQKLITGCQIPSIRKVYDQFLENAIDGASAFNFSLINKEGKRVSLDDLKGKTVVIDFWFTGCGACRETAPILRKIRKDLAGKPVVFVSISIDKNLSTWRKSVSDEIYSDEGNINLNAGDDKFGAEMINRYKVSGYPTLFIVDKNGRLYHVGSDPRLDNGLFLRKQIESRF